jgi:hypothetical protein
MPPDQAAETSDPETTSWLTKIQQAVNDFVKQFFAGADNLKEGYLPSPSPLSDDQAEQNLNNTLAGPEGYYGSTLPTEDTLPEGIEKPQGEPVKVGPVSIPFTAPINTDEKFYEQSYMPQEICSSDGTCETVCPITGKCKQ